MISERYSRNIGAISEAEQETLLGRRVLVAGGGGLGGNVIAGLLRIGVGGVTLVDFDRFDETNLNRQLLCTLPDIGRAKAEAAAEYAAAVNPDVKFTAVRERLDGISCRRLLSGHDLAIDALDNAESRAELAAACREAGIPLVYGAVGGWTLQVSVILPEHPEGLVERLYSGGASKNKACLSFTPAVCAGIQTAEAVKLLLGKPTELAGRLLCMDLLQNEQEYISLV